jgi:myo-inositol-1(or 4)-monophosphatase
MGKIAKGNFSFITMQYSSAVQFRRSQKFQGGQTGMTPTASPHLSDEPIAELEKFAEIGAEIAQRAGGIIATEFKIHTPSLLKEDKTPVTEIDKTVNRMVIEQIKQHFPDHGIIGEEESLCEGTEKYIWYTDPLDGTAPYESGSTNCVTNLALSRGGEIILGIIYDPFHDHLFLARKGRGASRNGVPIHVNSDSDFECNKFGGVPWIKHKFDIRPCMNEIAQRGAHTPNYGSTSLMATLVATGGFSGVIYAGDDLTDVAAPDIIITEAGGRSTDKDGRPHQYGLGLKANGGIFSNGIMHPSLETVIKETILLR